MRTKIAKGVIELDKNALRTLQAGEMASIIEAIQIANENLVDVVGGLSKKVIFSIGSPATIWVDLKRLGELKQADVREALEKLADIQLRLAEEEATKIGKLLKR